MAHRLCRILRYGISWLVPLLVFLLMVAFVLIPFQDGEYGKVHQLTCDRLEANYVTCQNRRQGFLGLSQETQTFRLQSLTLDERETGSEDKTTVYFLSLRISGFSSSASPQAGSGQANPGIILVQIDEAEGNRARTQAQFDQLNRLLNGENSNPKVTLRYGDGLWRNFLLVLLWFGAVGLAGIVWQGMDRWLGLS
ncbi:MAG: hypothetical protein VKJ24_09055 [Synechococcales bacterium]|nr:hypothetical protein [Synechococcales bacterium]